MAPGGSRWLKVRVCVGGGLPGPLSRGAGAGSPPRRFGRASSELGAEAGNPAPIANTEKFKKERERATGREPGAAGRRGRVRLVSGVRTRRRHCLYPSGCRGLCPPIRSWSRFACPEPRPLGGVTGLVLGPGLGPGPGRPQGQPTVRGPCPSRSPPSGAGDGPVEPGSSGVKSSGSLRKPGADLEIGDGAGWRCLAPTPASGMRS